MKNKPKYILMVSIHGLIRGQDLELGRDADTGGQTKYVLELTQSLSKHPDVQRVDLMTRLIVDPQVSSDYSQPLEVLNPKANIIRIPCGNNEYIFKEQLWNYLDNFADYVLEFLKGQQRIPDLIHTHYADAGYVGIRLSRQLAIPLIHTGHSLGRSKRKRLLASGISRHIIEERYNMSRRINAEEDTLSSAELVITSTYQEINEQYAQYDYYEPRQMRVIPPGTDVDKFFPPQGNEWESPIFQVISKFLQEPKKPMVVTLSRLDQRKNIHALIEAFGESPELQEKANLIIFLGKRHDPKDLETNAQEVLQDILFNIDRYDLYGKVAYPKSLPAEDVADVYRLGSLSGGVFVNPALTEPFGLTLIEAAATGVPIVATKDGGPVDIIKNCQHGYLIDPLEPQDIAEKILKILDDPELWQTLAKNGMSRVREHYTWESHVDTYMKVLEPIIDQNSRLPPVPLQHRLM